MPNLNYAQVWEPELLEILMQGTLTSPFVTTNVKWLDAKTFHFTQMSTSGYKNHNRNGGWNKGSYAQKDVPYTVTHDRDVSFLVDRADVDETNATASINNISKTFEKTWVVVLLQGCAGSTENRRISFRNCDSNIYQGESIWNAEGHPCKRKTSQIQGEWNSDNVCVQHYHGCP